MNFEINRRTLPCPKNIVIESNNRIDMLVVTWDHIENPDHGAPKPEILGVAYNVYRGTSMSGAFYKLNDKPLLNNKYEDKSINLNSNTQYFYRVSTVCLFTEGETTESKPSDPEFFMIPTVNKWFNKMNERNMWILQNTGVLMDLYVRKTEGKKCSHCYDDYRGQSGDTNCVYCFGTTYEGGYEPMFRLYVRQKPATNSLDIGNSGYVINNNPGAWTISKVLIRNMDLLINPYGQIFSVTNANLSHAAGYFLHQELQMKELDHTDVRYKIERRNLPIGI